MSRYRTPLETKRVTLSVLMPVFNERETIESIVAAVHAAPVAPIRLELVVVDDCSTDGSRDVLQQLHEKGRIDKLHVQPENRGKGAAIKHALGMSTGDIVIVQDADLEYNPAEYPILLRPILDDLADVVYGSRFAGGSPRRVLYFWHAVGNQFLTLLSNMLTDINLSDMETCYKVFRREIIQGMPLRSQRFGFEPEITVKVAKANYRIYEVAISYAGRTYAEGKKIGWRDGVEALWTLLYYRFFDSTRIPRVDLTTMAELRADDARSSEAVPPAAQREINITS